MSDEKTYRSYGVTKLDDNYRISLNIKWLGQIIVGVTFIVLGYIRIENRIGELERRMELANADIAELVEKHIEEEEVKITKMQEQLKWYEEELNLNPYLGKKKKKRKVILTEDDFNHNYFINRELRKSTMKNSEEILEILIRSEERLKTIFNRVNRIENHLSELNGKVNDLEKFKIQIKSYWM